MLEEFRRGFEVCKDILLRPHAVTPWARLFEPYPFFAVKSAFYIGVRTDAVWFCSVLFHCWLWIYRLFHFLPYHADGHVSTRHVPQGLTAAGYTVLQQDSKQLLHPQTGS